MKRSLPFTVTLFLVVACADDRPTRTATPTEPQAPALTSKSLPATASTVCRASVRERERLLAVANSSGSRGSGGGLALSRVKALDELISDTCY